MIPQRGIKERNLNMTTQETIANLTEKEHYDLSDLRAVMRILRSDVGCPWDREQDHRSIRPSLIEEAYEVVEAIDTENPALLREELGDLLFQIVFHAQLEQEAERFSMDEVIDDITAKMIHRHPHVFGDVSVAGSGEVLSNWERIKTEEKQRDTLVKRLRAVPPMLPALMRASKIAKKAGAAAKGCEGEKLDQMEAILRALREENISAEERQKAFGELLFCASTLAVCMDVDAEYSLSQATDAFISEIEAKNA